MVSRGGYRRPSRSTRLSACLSTRLPACLSTCLWGLVGQVHTQRPVADPEAAGKNPILSPFSMNSSL